MSFSNAAETAILGLLFNNLPIAGLGDAGGPQPSAAPGSLYLSLHTADPGEAGTQDASEAAYAGYARGGIPRNGGGWTIAGNQVANAIQAQFPICTGGAAVVTHFAIGTAAAGAGMILVSGALNAALAISNGIQPQFPAATLTATLD